ncbi:aminotransferase class I/II-fold pyridoxal phosphate-dependent enzyme [Salimicrobium halophilum]|uniref:Aminotransferase n=1 Tax=Salimicrobium halophilum TaxID=86666 RepID=A0A1G8R240_9BACI|nr:aminotransferase class I/II-fold pyridoxal phosphate-dependent enzyme [Salimicrobium halophilum]SDJ10470.1 aminotransferase [Salimicrobium halophilum]
MALKLNKHAVTLEVPGIRQFANQLKDYQEAINLTIGQPDFPTPPAVKDAGMKAIIENETAYSHNAGLLSLREAVHRFFKEEYNLTYDPDSEIVITNGASEALDSVFRSILEEGDEVIITAPAYSAYEALVELAGAKAVYLDTTDTEFLPTKEKLESLITSKTKAVLFNYPSNPTGVTIPKPRMDELVEVLEKKEIYIVSDEIYSENTFSGRHHTFAAYPELRDRTFLIHGLSKSHSMTGWRVGFVLSDAPLMKVVLNVHLYNSICVALPSQYGAIEALTGSRDVPKEMNHAYIARRDFVYKRLTEMGLPTVKPNGAFYIFPSIEEFGLSSFEFCDRLLKEGGVACVPGSAFSKYGEGFFRISYAYSMPVLEEGLARLEAFLKQLKKEVS